MCSLNVYKLFIFILFINSGIAIIFILPGNIVPANSYKAFICTVVLQSYEYVFMDIVVPSLSVCEMMMIEVDPDTSSSYSPISESNMQFRSTGNLSATPLRVARSAEVLTPAARRNFFYDDGRQDNSDNNSNLRRKSEVNNALEERPKFHLVI
ncbi:hypothetical protein MAR_022842 [Mya arenaria]|uniref:Uncharacterized protein n=1 Tax=Mya arenaria TaxID=6604 RepID=A0ABY7DM76_MYAAR|nr:hypothetical protein MAR_022842 [Mya arenaria]